MSAPYISRGNTHIFWHAERSWSYGSGRRRNWITENKHLCHGVSLVVPPKEDKEVRRVDSGHLRDDMQEQNLVIDEYISSQFISRLITPKIPTRASASPNQVLRFLLSDAGLETSRPTDELHDIQSRGKITTYAQLLSPFEELLCAVVLSRSRSHSAALHTIRTVLNAPYNFRSPLAIINAGPEKVYEVLLSTQANSMSREDIELTVDAISSNTLHKDLPKLRRQAKSSSESEREVLRRGIKGMGKNGLDIFYRRIQWLWTEAYPTIDIRTQISLEKLGLPTQSHELAKMIDANWDKLKLEDGRDSGQSERRRRAFVLLLERAVSADLELKSYDVLEKAMRA